MTFMVAAHQWGLGMGFLIILGTVLASFQPSEEAAVDTELSVVVIGIVLSIAATVAFMVRGALPAASMFIGSVAIGLLIGAIVAVVLKKMAKVIFPVLRPRPVTTL